MVRYYIGHTSIFDGTRKYNAVKIGNAIKHYGGKQVRVSRQFGWSNQPQVVCFNAPNDKIANEIAQKASDLIFPKKRSSLIHLIAYKKDW